MQNRAQKIVFFFSFALLTVGSTQGANVTLGSPNDGNCYPFNCNDSASGSGQAIEYQQVFSGAQFGSSPFTINSITFSDEFLTLFGFSNVPLLGGTYTFSFAITNAAVGALSTTLSDNISSGFAGFLTTTTGGMGAGFTTLTFNGTTPYVYNPLSGNLLLDIVVTNQANVQSSSYDPPNGFDADDTGAVTSRAFRIGTSPGVADSVGLVTTFSSDPLTVPTPEPGSYALIAVGLAALLGWKKRSTVALGGLSLGLLLTLGLQSKAHAQTMQGRMIAVPMHTIDGAPAAFKSAHRSASSNAAVQIFSVPTFSRNYTIDSVVYPQTFVGTDPALTDTTTSINAFVVPIILVLNDGAGPTYNPTARLSTAPSGSALSATLSTLTSPIFQNANYATGGTNVGNGIQFGDAMMRASFWDSVSTTSPNWHTVLKVQVKPAVTLTVPADKGKSDGAFASVDINWLGSKLDGLALPFGSTNLPVFVLHQVVQTQNGSCCVLGFHSVIQTGQNYQTYVMGTYLDPGQFGNGLSDVAVLSHEVVEWLTDPFVNNIVPPWPAPFTFVPPGPPYPGQCQNNLETGDPIEDRSDPSKVVLHVTTLGRQYTLQNEVLPPWFLHVSPSFSVNGYYTYLGPIDNEFVSFAPACPTP